MILYTNFKNTEVNGKTKNAIPVLLLTSSKLKSEINSNANKIEFENFCTKNKLNDTQQNFIKNLFKEANTNCFFVTLKKDSKMIKNPLRYPGGKSKAIDQILPLIPCFEEFREPFVGGGSVFLALKQLYPNKKYWINDLYFELYKFWEYVQKDLQSVVEQVNDWKQEFESGKQLHRFLSENMSSFNDIEKAGAFLYSIELHFQAQQKQVDFLNKPFKNDLLKVVFNV